MEMWLIFSRHIYFWPSGAWATQQTPLSNRHNQHIDIVSPIFLSLSVMFM